MDNNKAQCFRAIANVMLEVQSAVIMSDELLALMRLNLEMHRVPSITGARVVGEDAFQYHDRHRSIRKKGIRSVCEREKKQFHSHILYLDFNWINVNTSDNDRTGGLTQSSQHFERTVRRTMGGGTPSHFVLSCNWRRFNWQNISVRKAMNAANNAIAQRLNIREI